MEVFELEKELLPLGTTALHIAVNSGQVEGLRVLLEQDCSITDHTDYYGNTPLATALKNGRLKAAEVLIKYGASLDGRFGNGTIAQALVHTPTFYPLLSPIFQSNTLLHCDTSCILPVLAYEGEPGVLEAVLKTHKVKVDYRDNIKCTALHYASQRGFSKMVKMLLDHSAKVTIKNASGSTPLHIACSAGHLDVVVAILEADTDLENAKYLLNTKNISGNTPVMFALRNTRFEVVRYIFETYRECLNMEQVLPGGHILPGFCFYLKYLSPTSTFIKSKFRVSIPCLSSEEAPWLVHESVYGNDTSVLRAALAHGASVECLDYMQQTPLILAAKLGSVEMCKCLIEEGADLSVADVSGKTALVHAIEYGRCLVVACFLTQFSLTDFDPCILSGPISSAILAVLVSHFEENDSKPTKWLGWLALAVTSATKDMFVALVNAIAPSDWVQQLISNNLSDSMASDTHSLRLNRVAIQPTLPVYVQEMAVGESMKPQPKLIRSFSQPRKWYFAKTPPSTLTHWTFKHLPRPRRLPTPLRKKGTPFSLCRTRAAQTHSSVIHEAALHNIDILRFILSSCGVPSLQQKVLLSRDKMGRTALELVLPQFELISDAISSLQLSEVGGLDEYLRQTFTLSDSLLFEEALVHYLCADKCLFLRQHSRRYKSPLQAWPQWYLQQQVNAVCANYDSGYLLLPVLEDRKKLLLLLLSHNFFPSRWSEEYPPPLFAAIQNNCLWAVEPLLLHGADPATHYSGRFAIEEAIRRDQIVTVRLLLQSGFTSFLTLSDNTQLFSSLSSTLGRLVSAGCPQYAVSLIEGLNLGRYLWYSRSASHFLFLVQAGCDGSDIYKVILRDFVTFLCTEMVHWENENSKVTSDILRSVRWLKHRCFLNRVNASKRTRDLLLLLEASCTVLSSSVEFRDLFNIFCSNGNDVIHFLLEMSRPEVVKQLVNKPDTRGLTPLFHAACCGHLDTVRLLLDHGAIVTCNTGLPPLLGALLYLSLAPYNVGGDTLGRTYNYSYILRHKLLNQYRSLLPSIRSFSRINDDSSGATELVKLLLPARSESVYTLVTTFPAPYRSLHSLLVLISSARETSVLEHLLDRMASEEIPSLFGESTASGESTNKSVLFAALTLAPANAHNRAAQLFESFLLHFVTDGEVCLKDIFVAARKGYWNVIDAVVSAKRVVADIPKYKPKKIVADFLETCLLMIKLGKQDLLCSLFQLVQQSQSHLITQGWPRLVKAAVSSDNTDTVHALVSAGCGVTDCLLAAARWGKDKVLESFPVDEIAKCFVDILKTAARYNQQAIVQLLFNRYCNDTEVIIDSQLPRNVAFWLWVLAESASSSHQSLALQAVACLSESEMRSIVSQHTLYHKILYYNCYWGLTNLMACIPCSKEALLVGKEYESPLDAALANGKIGYIPDHLASSLSNDVHSWLKGSLVTEISSAPLAVLLTGLFHQLASMESSAVSTTSDLCLKDAVDVKILCRPNAFAAFQKLTGKFCAPFLMYAVQECQFNVLHEVVTIGDAILLEQVLRSLLSSGLLSQYCSHSNTSVLRKAVMADQTACLELLLRSGDVFVKQLSAVNSSGYNVLHSAVLGRGHGIDTLAIVLEWLNESAPDMCFSLDNEGNMPYTLAFRLGKYKRAAKLLEVARLSGKWMQSDGWLSDAKMARGWIHVICGRVYSGDEKEVYPVPLNLRSCDVSGLFQKAVLKGNSRMVNALLTASCGMLLHDKQLLIAGLLDQSVLEFLRDVPPYVTISNADATDIICHTLRKRDCSKEVEKLIDFYNQHRETISINTDRIFLTACAFARVNLVRYLLCNMTTLPIEVLQEGVEKALSYGACEVAAAILLSGRIEHAKSSDLKFSKSSVLQVIFVTSREYKTIVEDFFGSLARSEKVRHLAFSEEWLVHTWGPYQMQLLERRVSNSPDIPPNPWMVGVQWQEQPHTVTLSIDWESFASCLQGIPGRQFTPMLVEAVVLSSSVLGQLCLTEDNNGHIYNLAEFFDCPQPLTSLVISAVMWPESPSASLTSSGEGLLILSYMPDHRVFAFPPAEKTDRGWNESYSTDSGMHSLCFTDTSVDTKYDECSTDLFTEDLRDVCTFYQRKLKHKHVTSTSIAVDGVSGVLDLSFVSSVVELCSEAIQLSFTPSTTYADIPKTKRKWYLPAPPSKKLFNHVGINIEVAKEQGSTSSSVVSLVDGGVDFCVTLALNDSIRPRPVVMPDFELLLRQTVYCTLSRELQVLQGRLVQLINTQFISQMRRALRCSLAANSVTVMFEDVSGAVTKMSLVSVKHLQVLKGLPGIKHFLDNFCDILHTYSHKPKVLSEIRTFFQRGFRLVLSQVSRTTFAVCSSLPQLTILMSDLSHLKQRQRYLISLTQSLLKLSKPGEDQCVKDLLKEVPCPFLTHVDLKRSKSFLYARVGSDSKLVVQVVSYDGNNLSLPLKYNCCLQVSIRSPESNIVKASSSEEPSSQGASANLLVTTTEDGQFETVWRPSEEGVHSIMLTLNGVKIQDTFKRVFVEKSADVSCGRRQVVAGNVVLVAAHLGDACPYDSRDSKVILTRNTIIEPCHFLKNVPEFTSPFSSTSASTITSPSLLRSSDKLKEAVSAMTGPLPQGSGVLDLPSPPLLHHISVTAAWRGSRRWSHTSCRSVTMHYSAQEETPKKNNCKKRKTKSSYRTRRRSRVQMCRSFVAQSVSSNGCVALGNGMYRVSLQCQQTGTYRVFASCPLCQSVMRIYWMDEESFYPELFYVLPGPFSSEMSSIFEMKTGVHPEKNVYKPGKHGFYLDCFDKFGNSHTVGKSIRKAVVKGAGPLKVGPEPSLAAIQTSSLRDHAECEVRYIAKGTYAITCTLLGAGMHQLQLTDVCGGTHLMAAIRVQPGQVWPPHCWLDPNNSYEAVPFKPYTCHIYLYDRYFNPCCSCDSNVTVYLGSHLQSAKLSPAASPCSFMLQFTPEVTCISSYSCDMKISINGQFIADTPKTLKMMEGSLRKRLCFFRKLFAKSMSECVYNPMLTVRISRSNILHDALQNRIALKYANFHVKFLGENGIDAGGMSREFFHLLSKEMVNPQYALFQNTNGLHRPNPHSSVNPNHLNYFSLCGEVLARMIYENYQTVVHFIPAVYKFLLGQTCTLEDVKAEDPTLYNGLTAVARCDDEESLDQLAMNFTTSYTYFGSQETVELVTEGHKRKVTLQNRHNYVNKFYQWHLIGCVKSQLDSMRSGFSSIILHSSLSSIFYWRELEMVLCGQQTVDISFLKSCTQYDGYSAHSPVVVWLWEVVETFSQEEWQKFLQFTTGSARVPVADTSQWKIVIKKGSQDESLLPTAATCFNTLHLPCYATLDTLSKKLMQAISYGHLHFLNH